MFLPYIFSIVYLYSASYALSELPQSKQKPISESQQIQVPDLKSETKKAPLKLPSKEDVQINKPWYNENIKAECVDVKKVSIKVKYVSSYSTNPSLFKIHIVGKIKNYSDKLKFQEHKNYPAYMTLESMPVRGNFEFLIKKPFTLLGPGEEDDIIYTTNWDVRTGKHPIGYAFKLFFDFENSHDRNIYNDVCNTDYRDYLFISENTINSVIKNELSRK